jgi:hypothetical protein
MVTAINSAASGLSRASVAVERSAQRVSAAVQVDDVSGDATSLPYDADLTRQLVALKMSEASYSANAAVIKAVDRMNEVMLDMLA